MLYQVKIFLSSFWNSEKFFIIDYKIIETKQHKKTLQTDSQATNNPTICNKNVKIQSNEEVNAEKSNNIQHVKEGEI